MKFFEKHFPEKRRLRIFAFFYALLFTILLTCLFFRQVWEKEDYLDIERKQGQRRIVRPGARGDVFDRENRLLIGNRPSYSANLHLELLSKEIWERKVELRRISFQLRESLTASIPLRFEDVIRICGQNWHVKKRGLFLRGMRSLDNAMPRLWMGAERINDLDVQKDSWACHLDVEGILDKSGDFRIEGVESPVQISVAGLFSLAWDLSSEGKFAPKFSQVHSNGIFIDFFERESTNPLGISIDGLSYTWESRFSVVCEYLEKVNRLSGRNLNLSMLALQRHWRRKLILPLELCGDLSHKEFATLIENLPPDSPIQVQAQPVRHYPEGSLASHVLGYVGSGYQADSDSLTGADLATFELEGRTGKAGVERTFEETLRGKDGADVWTVNPMGSRYERVDHEPSQKGGSLRLGLDKDLQSIAEEAIDRMVTKVAEHRILPDNDWARTLERRTSQALKGTNETEVRAELLLSAFKDAPFPISGRHAATVAGFRGTENDACRLLRHLYSQGVLQEAKNDPNSFELAPPPPPPGAAVLIDLNSSRILALASKPNYDLSSLSPYITQAAYDDIQRREAWLPRAWHPGYAPASPFKLVTALAALRSDTLSPEEKLTCDGIYRGMKCHVHPGRHGDLDLREAIAQSCNVYFFRCAERLGHGPIIDEAIRLGMDRKPTIELPRLRDQPIVPDPQWKKRTLGVNWTMEDTFNISIGQGGLRQSPLQMACFAAKMATNTQSFHPTLLMDSNEASTADAQTLIEPSSIKAIVEGMLCATTEGTARRCRIEGIEIAGKTGTGQWRNHNMKLNLAWFIGFAPVENPKVALSVLVEGVIPQDQVQGGLTATPIARDLFSAYFAKHPLP